MAEDMEQLYGERLKRYVTAMRNDKPDMIPIRPFVAEFTAKYAGFTCQDITHDFEKAFDAVVGANNYLPLHWYLKNLPEECLIFPCLIFSFDLY